MQRIVPLLLIGWVVCLAQPTAVSGQSDPHVWPEPAELTTEQDHRLMMQALGIDSLRPGANPNDPAAPNAVNYDEARANPYPELPDPLLLKNGQRVGTPSMWWQQRRPEIVEDFDREIYGRVPDTVPAVQWEVTETGRTNKGRIPVITKQIVGHVDNASYPPIAVDIQLTLTTPADAIAPVPVMMEFGWGAMGERWRRRFGGQDGPDWKDQVLAKGWGYAILVPTSIQADNGAGLTRGIIGLCNQGQPRKPDDWGALRAWAWGASRALDYLETDPAVDATQVGIEGLSRYGKAALVAMAYDQRFAIGFIGSSGEGGAKLHRRVFGELVENLTGSGGYHWMAGNFLKYGGPLNASDLPVDAHELIALCAPRPTFISYGAAEGPGAEGQWVDQRGSFMAAVAAGPVFQLLGKKDLGTAEFPAVEVALTDGDLAWRQHGGGHTTGPNWPVFLEWADRSIQNQHWVTTWACAPQLTEPRNLPPGPLADNTLRQFVQTTIDGNRLRVRFSNGFGTNAVVIRSVHVALSQGTGSAGDGSIQTETDTALTFNGGASIVIPPGEAVYSDPVAFDLPALTSVAVSIHFGDISATTLTGHPGSRTTSLVQPGDAVAAASLPSAERTPHWYILTGIEVLASPARRAVAVLGDSITDGRGSTTDGNDRWPDQLARRLETNAPTAGVAVVNMGIGGNGLFAGLGPPAVQRFERDILDQSGVRWIIVFEGVNDVGGATATESAAVAQRLIQAYVQFAEKAHQRDLLAYAATLTPFGESFYDSPAHEAGRQTINQWLRTNAVYDAVIDFDLAVRDPANPARLLPAYDTGDHLHLNPDGYRAMANAVDLSLFDN